MCGRTCTRVLLQGTTRSGRNFNIQVSLCVQPDNEWYNKMLLLRFDVKMIDIQPWPEQLLVSSTKNLWANCKLKLIPQVLSTGEWRYNNDLGNSVGRLTFNSSSFSLLTSTSCFFSCLTRLRHSSSLCAFVCVRVCVWERVCVCVCAGGVEDG